MVGNISNVEPNSSTMPFFIGPPQKIPGALCPPSQEVPFPFLKSPEEPECCSKGSHGPLSEVKMTRVSFSAPSFFR